VVVGTMNDEEEEEEEDISALLDSWVTNTPYVKIVCQQKYCFSLHCIFVKTRRTKMLVYQESVKVFFLVKLYVGV
jgi:hypothetical protein